MLAIQTRSFLSTYRALSTQVLKQGKRSIALSILKCYSTTEKSVEKETVVPPKEAVASTEASKASDANLLQQVESITSQLEALQEKQNDLMNKYKRSLADSENMRVRLNKQISDAKVYGIQSFCKDLLEVADILGHATEAVPSDAINDKNPHLKNLYDGLTMTKAALNQVFRRHGLEAINPLNEKFDPNLHEALFMKDQPDTKPNTIVSVTKLGYKLHDRCIRPALVGVSKG